MCTLHMLKGRLGLGPLYMVLGLCEAFLFVGYQFAVRVDLPLGPNAFISYELFLPMLLSGIAMIYVLEGTSESRRLIVALALLYFVHGVVDFSFDYYAHNPPPGETFEGRYEAVTFNIRDRWASLITVMVDFVVMIVIYQGLRNRLARLPLAIPFFVAIVIAMVVDGVLFSTLAGYGLDPERLQLIEKAQAGVAAAIPMSAYLAWQLRRHRDEVEGGVLQRGAFEIIDLRRTVVEIRAKLKEQRAQYAYIKDSFSRYVSPEIVDAIIEDPSRLRLGGEVRDVTVLFVDIQGYTRISEELEPEGVLQLLNQYLSQVSSVILSNGGMINEFEGDAVLAIFGAPLDLEDHADRAVETARGILAALAELNAAWAEDGTLERVQASGQDRVSVRIGIHSGPVVAGNIGSEQRIKYAVIGDTVNTASRVEELNKRFETTVLITAETHTLLSRALESTSWSPQGEHQVDGRKQPVDVLSLDLVG